MKRPLTTAALSAALLGFSFVPATAQPSAPSSAPSAPAADTQRVEQASWPGHSGPGWHHRGRLLEARRLDNAAALPSAAKNYFVKYTSVGARGQRIVVSGTVAIPGGKAPRHGWPVLSWAHGTTGTADACAPSRDTVDGPAHGYLGTMAETLDRWVAEGFVVVATDYEGLGTRGPHPYINGESAANTVVDIVRAARQLDRRVGREFVAAGHSQGGHAALYTAAQPQGRHGVDLRGAIALAPGSMTSQIVQYVQSGGPGAQQTLGFAAVILAGAAAADPTLDLDAVLTDVGEDFVDRADTECLAQLTQAGLSVDPKKVFEPGADFSALEDYLRSQEPENLTIIEPTAVLQGTADLGVLKTTTDYVVGKLRERSDQVLYITYEGADHRGVVAASFADQLAYANAVLSR